MAVEEEKNSLAERTAPRPALKLCPCCGAQAGFGEIRFASKPPIEEPDGSRPAVRRYVHCAYCQTNNNGIAHGYATEQQAADAWNTRFWRGPLQPPTGNQSQ